MLTIGNQEWFEGWERRNGRERKEREKNEIKLLKTVIVGN